MEVGKIYFIQKKKTDSNTLYSYKRWEYRGENKIGHLFTYFDVDYVIPDGELNEFMIIEDGRGRLQVEKSKCLMQKS